MDDESTKSRPSVVRWGLIGCGDISEKRVAPAIRDIPNADLAAISRRQSELAEPFARKFGADRWYDSWEELVVDDAVDAVYVATPVYLHAEMTVAAAEAGKDVLCEKPMALDLAECDRMIQAARSNGVKLGIAYYRHFYPMVERIKEMIGGGELGDVIVVQANAFEYLTMDSDHPRHWFLEKDKAGGGPMFDFGCHRIEVFTNLLGSVTDLCSRLDRVVFDREVGDTGAVIFQFESGGMATLTVTHAVDESQDTLDVFGQNGSIHVPELNGEILRIVTDGTEQIERHPPHSNVHQPLIEQFNRAVLEDDSPGVDASVGREVNRLLAEIYEK
jgi:predicted dehydrogenase